MISMARSVLSALTELTTVRRSQSAFSVKYPTSDLVYASSSSGLCPVRTRTYPRLSRYSTYFGLLGVSPKPDNSGEGGILATSLSDCTEPYRLATFQAHAFPLHELFNFELAPKTAHSLPDPRACLRSDLSNIYVEIAILILTFPMDACSILGQKKYVPFRRAFARSRHGCRWFRILVVLVACAATCDETLASSYR